MKTLVATVLVCCLAGSTEASLIAERSVEWLCDFSDAMGVYRVASNSVVTTNQNGRQWWTYTLQLSESLKGNPPKECKSEFSVHGSAATNGDSIRGGDQVLVSFQTQQSNSPQILHQINLSRPWHAGAGYVAVTAQFSVLLDGKQITELVRARLGKQSGSSPPAENGPHHGTYVEVPPNTQAWKALWAGSACDLLVPDDLKPIAPKRKEQPTTPRTVP
jgi:hypothetical protein